MIIIYMHTNNSQRVTIDVLHKRLQKQYDTILKIKFNDNDPIVEYEMYMLNAAISSNSISEIDDGCARCIENLYKEFGVKS